MKKFIVLSIALLMLAGCKKSTDTDRVIEEPVNIPPQDITVDSPDGAESQIIPQPVPQDYNEHSAMNSLDYLGVYVLEGDHSQTVELQEWGKYIVGLDGTISEGEYQWDVTGTVIHMVIDGEDQTFFVGENFIKQVQPDEGRIFVKN